MTEGGILIAGGYGVVGQRIAAELAPDYQVFVAGRHLEQAKATAAAIGHGVRGRAIDVTAEASIAAALEGIATVMSCIDQPRRSLLHAAIERGLRYTDITPHLVELGRGAAYEELGASARASGACIVLGTGIVPGISNVIVRTLADALGGADVIETSLVLSASDAAGPASFDYFLRELMLPFEVHVNGADRPARAFSDPRVIRFPAPFGPRSAYLFPFSDQVLYPRTIAAQTVLSRLAIEPAALGRLLAALVRVDATSLVAPESVRRALTRSRPYHGCGRRRRKRHSARPDGGRGLRAGRVDARAGHESATLLLASRQARADRRVALTHQVNGGS